jgi:hypothetical protein
MKQKQVNKNGVWWEQEYVYGDIRGIRGKGCAYDGDIPTFRYILDIVSL